MKYLIKIMGTRLAVWIGLIQQDDCCPCGKVSFYNIEDCKCNMNDYFNKTEL